MSRVPEVNDSKVQVGSGITHTADVIDLGPPQHMYSLYTSGIHAPHIEQAMFPS